MSTHKSDHSDERARRSEHPLIEGSTQPRTWVGVALLATSYVFGGGPINTLALVKQGRPALQSALARGAWEGSDGQFASLVAQSTLASFLWLAGCMFFLSYVVHRSSVSRLVGWLGLAFSVALFVQGLLEIDRPIVTVYPFDASPSLHHSRVRTGSSNWSLP
jgi:hypothetical protein